MAASEIFFYNPETNWYLNKDVKNVDSYCKMFQHGHLTWIVQTYMRLKNAGYPCSLKSKIPEKGIILVHPEHLPSNFIPNKYQFIVCVVADRMKHRYAQMHIVQNKKDWILNDQIWGGHYIPHWPQVGLIPRNPSRGDQIKNISYFGQKSWLAPYFFSTEWINSMNELSLNFNIPSPEKWNDYSSTDIVIGIRGFSNNLYFDKPASKLVNSWLAGVPAILGRESAFISEKISNLDYIEISKEREVLVAIKKLISDTQLFNKMITNGHSRALEFSPEKITEHWVSMLDNSIIPKYQIWLSKSEKEINNYYRIRFFSYIKYRFRLYLNNKF